MYIRGLQSQWFIIIFPTFDPLPSLHSHNWSHFRQPTVHTRHCGLPRASLVAAASCDQHMGFHRLSQKIKGNCPSIVEKPLKNNLGIVPGVRIHRNPVWCQHRCVLHQQITSQKLQQWLLQIWTPFQQHSNLAIDPWGRHLAMMDPASEFQCCPGPRAKVSPNSGRLGKLPSP